MNENGAKQSNKNILLKSGNSFINKYKTFENKEVTVEHNEIQCWTYSFTKITENVVNAN